MQIQQRKDSKRLQWKNANNVNGQSQIGRSIWRDKRLKFTSSIFVLMFELLSKSIFPQVAATNVFVHPAQKCNIENHQSWTIVARNIAIAGINHPLSWDYSPEEASEEATGKFLKPSSLLISKCLYHRIGLLSISPHRRLSTHFSGSAHSTCLDDSKLDWEHHSPPKVSRSTWNRI